MPLICYNGHLYHSRGSKEHTILDIQLESIEISDVIKELQLIRQTTHLPKDEVLLLTFDEYSCMLGVVIAKLEDK